MNEFTDLQIITSFESADQFFYWLAEHPQVVEIQGYKVYRFNQDNRVYSLQAGPLTNYFDVEWIYKNRKMLNDWIRSQGQIIDQETAPQNIWYKPDLAAYKAMANGSSIITVLAENEDRARQLITDQLQRNPSRAAFLKIWQAQGQVVELWES